jgi:excisionase family DNA binding protein
MKTADKLSDGSKVAYSIKSASEASDIPVSTLWMYIKNGTLQSHKVGRRRLIPRESLQRLVHGGV